DLVLVGPSNPVVSIGPILAVPGIRSALRSTPAPVLGFSGILHGAPVLGMAHRLLPTIGVAVDAAAVGRHYGARSGTGVLDAWVLDTADAASAAALEADGLPTLARDLVMSSPDATAAFVRSAVDEVLGSRGGA
ncbi:MAG: 2-phospho-L-lactate transferase CofD family protein, partial [Janthinobacterium lividum]